MNRAILFILHQILVITNVLVASPEQNCLQKGCSLSGGLQLNDLNELLVANGDHFADVINVLQWNNLYDKYDIGEDSWMYRKQHVCQYINAIKPELIGLQEVMESQLRDLKECLPDYIAFGEPRDSEENPLYNPVFVRKSEKLRVVRSGTFWLSLTPEEKGSKTHRSKEPRISTWVEVMIKRQNGGWKQITMATTHLAYRSMETATIQITKLMSYLKKVVLNNDQKEEPVIVTGDFNWGSNSTVYKTMQESFKMHNSMAEAKWVFPELTALPPYPGLIDYVWQRGFNSVLSATLTDVRPDNGRMLSDHRPVLATLRLLS